jgi:hypothetical protein
MPEKMQWNLPFVDLMRHPFRAPSRPRAGAADVGEEDVDFLVGGRPLGEVIPRRRIPPSPMNNQPMQSDCLIVKKPTVRDSLVSLLEHCRVDIARISQVPVVVPLDNDMLLMRLCCGPLGVIQNMLFCPLITNITKMHQNIPIWHLELPMHIVRVRNNHKPHNLLF